MTTDSGDRTVPEPPEIATLGAVTEALLVAAIVAGIGAGFALVVLPGIAITYLLGVLTLMLLLSCFVLRSHLAARKREVTPSG